MKNVLKVSFFALALGLFAASCNNASTTSGDTTNVAIDSPVAAPVDTNTVAPIDTNAIAPVDTTTAAPAPAAH
ncbi:hypothetical protein MKQ70_36860 [Chitinophaga sedimenti]|uniref:hypothetical protein n=1 Tax=Chitinophaga sedimenti TaxID=2033606 RepID=UPI002002CA45|nr:hypothetical protein [Chitinophaga sedimenti]MCK7560188.1 hypothetical protein [Chitinophaga sedimenti]